jgi:glucose-6-phosphate isomerase
MGQINRSSRKHGFRCFANSSKKAATACEQDACSEEVFRNDLLDALTENAKEFLQAGLNDHVEHEAVDVSAGKSRVVLCGMGGSSLGPEVIALTYKKEIFIFDSTDPNYATHAIGSDLANTMVFVSSKS